MKKILVLTTRELISDTEHICLILQTKYHNKFLIKNLKTMNENEPCEYVYIVFSQKNTQEEISFLKIQASLWTQNPDHIVPIKIDTIKNADTKIRKRKERKLRREYPNLGYQN